MDGYRKGAGEEDGSVVKLPVCSVLRWMHLPMQLKSVYAVYAVYAGHIGRTNPIRKDVAARSGDKNTKISAVKRTLRRTATLVDRSREQGLLSSC